MPRWLWVPRWYQTGFSHSPLSRLLFYVSFSCPLRFPSLVFSILLAVSRHHVSSQCVLSLPHCSVVNSHHHFSSSALVILSSFSLIPPPIPLSEYYFFLLVTYTFSFLTASILFSVTRSPKSFFPTFLFAFSSSAPSFRRFSSYLSLLPVPSRSLPRFLYGV